MSQRRVAVIPVERRKGKCRLVLITKRRHKDWIVPSGKPEAKLSDKRVAALEAFEEAGVVGKLEKLDDVPSLTMRSHSGKKRKVKVYGLLVSKKLDRWPERKQRKRRIVKANELDRFDLDKPLRRAIRQYLKNI